MRAVAMSGNSTPTERRVYARLRRDRATIRRLYAQRAELNETVIALRKRLERAESDHVTMIRTPVSLCVHGNNPATCAFRASSGPCNGG